MSGTLPWYVARAGGLVAYVLLTVTVLWGTLVAVRAFRHRPGLAWVNGMHEWLGALTIGFLGVHVAGLLADTYVGFGPTQILVPFTSSYRPGAVAWGVVGLYLLAATYAVARFRRHLPKRLRPMWKRVHLAAYPLFGVSTIHLLRAGTDARVLPVTLGAAGAITAVTWAGAARRVGLTGNSQPPSRSAQRWESKVPV